MKAPLNKIKTPFTIIVAILFLTACSSSQRPLLNDIDNSNDFSSQNGVVSFIPDNSFHGSFILSFKNINTQEVSDIELKPTLRKLTLSYVTVMGEVTSQKITETPTISTDVALYELKEGTYIPILAKVKSRSGNFEFKLGGDTLKVSQNKMTVLGYLNLDFIKDDSENIFIKFGGFNVDERLEKIKNEKIKNLERNYFPLNACSGSCNFDDKTPKFEVALLKLINTEKEFSQNVNVKEFSTFTKEVDAIFKREISKCNHKNRFIVSVTFDSTGNVNSTIRPESNNCLNEIETGNKLVNQMNFKSKNKPLTYEAHINYF
jgi:hypothetical protein